jgi:hypothetical protein
MLNDYVQTYNILLTNSEKRDLMQMFIDNFLSLSSRMRLIIADKNDPDIFNTIITQIKANLMVDKNIIERIVNKASLDEDSVIAIMHKYKIMDEPAYLEKADKIRRGEESEDIIIDEIKNIAS